MPKGQINFASRYMSNIYTCAIHVITGKKTKSKKPTELKNRTPAVFPSEVPCVHTCTMLVLVVHIHVKFGNELVTSNMRNMRKQSYRTYVYTYTTGIISRQNPVMIFWTSFFSHRFFFGLNFAIFWLSLVFL